jgi:hypothetical protein
MLYELWKKAAAANPNKVVLVGVGKESVVTFVMASSMWTGVAYSPVYKDAIGMTRRLDEMGVEWVLVNAPDDVAAACGVPVE